MNLKYLSISIVLLLGIPGYTWAVDRVQIGPLKVKRIPAPKKANLVVQAAGWERELCVGTCPQVKQDLKINKVNCRFRVRVANIGNKSTGTFAIQLRYTHWKGSDIIQKVKWIGTGLAAKNQGTWYKDVYFPNIGYYHTGSPFIVKVDYSNKVNESNESDNTKTVNP